MKTVNVSSGYLNAISTGLFLFKNKYLTKKRELRVNAFYVFFSISPTFKNENALEFSNYVILIGRKWLQVGYKTLQTFNFN